MTRFTRSQSSPCLPSYFVTLIYSTRPNVDVANDIWKKDNTSSADESDEFSAELEKLFNVSNQ